MTDALTPAPGPSGPVPRDAGSPAFPVLPVSLGPDRTLLTYYVLTSVLLGPFFLFKLVPDYFRFRTMQYQVDDEGISMRWGVLFRKEVSLTYARIQDIHLSSNFVERWLGLARIQVQTASGSASAEMTIEGLKNHEAIRDFLYSRMRGVRETVPTVRAGRPGAAVVGEEATPDELVEALRAVTAEIRALREDLSRERSHG